MHDISPQSDDPASPASTERLSSEREGKQTFARFSPMNDAARLAMHEVVLLSREVLESQSWKKHLKVGDTASFRGHYESDSESETLVAHPTSIITAEYELSLDELPHNIALGWRIGGGHDRLPNKGVDILITTKKREHRVGGTHARIGLNLQSGTTSIHAGKRRVEVNGHTVTNGQRLLDSEATDVTFGNLTFRIQFLPVDQSTYREKFDTVRKYYAPMNEPLEMHDSLSSTPTPVVPPNYSLQTVIGEGTYGTIYICLRKSDSALYAAKRMSRTPKNLRMIKKEIQILREVQSHENVINLVDCWFSRGTEASLGNSPRDEAFLIIGPLALDNLSLIISSESIWDVGNEVIRQIGEGVKHVHGCGIIHGDIKPENFLIASFLPLRFLLSDFGHSTMAKNSKDHFRGTIPYLAPEILELKRLASRGATDDMKKAQPWTFACDDWSVGLIAYQMFKKTPKLCDMNNGVNESMLEKIRNELQGNRLWRDCALMRSFALELLKWKWQDRNSVKNWVASSKWPSRVNIHMPRPTPP